MIFQFLIPLILLISSCRAQPCRCSSYLGPLNVDLQANSATQTSTAILQIIESLNLNPPVIARLVSIWGECLFSAASHKGKLAPLPELDTRILGSLYAFVNLNFPNEQRLLNNQTFPSPSPGEIAHAAFSKGYESCSQVIANAEDDGFNSQGMIPGCPTPTPYCEWTGFFSVNNPQEQKGIINCSSEMRSLDHWQPLVGPQVYLMPHTAYTRPYALDLSSLIPNILSGPPRTSDNLANAMNQTQQVIEASSSLDDENKAIAVFWSNYVNGANEGLLYPPGFWIRTAILSLIATGSSTTDSIKLLYTMGHSMKDAAIASWAAKFTYSSSRPVQWVQCLLASQSITAWKGPYQGVGTEMSSTWSSFLATPPFPGYASGHSTFGGAGAEILRLFYQSDDYKGPNCWLQTAGSNPIEPAITDPSSPYFIPGVTNVPNSGPNTVGFSPATDVTICWKTWSETAAQTAHARVLGGVHVPADCDDGLLAGEFVARSVWTKASMLWGSKIVLPSVPHKNFSWGKPSMPDLGIDAVQMLPHYDN